MAQRGERFGPRIESAAASPGWLGQCQQAAAALRSICGVPQGAVMWDQLGEQYASGAASHAFHHMHISGIHNLVAIGQACCQSVDRSATALPRLSAALYCAAYGHCAVTVPNFGQTRKSATAQHDRARLGGPGFATDFRAGSGAAAGDDQPPGEGERPAPCAKCDTGCLRHGNTSFTGTC